MVYKVLVVGEAVTVAPVVGDKPVVGDQFQLKLAKALPVTERLVEPPLQMVTVSVTGLQTVDKEGGAPGQVTENKLFTALLAATSSRITTKRHCWVVPALKAGIL